MLLRRASPFLKLIRCFNQENFSKTTPVFLKDIAKSTLMIDKYSKAGFHLTNDMNVIGSMVIFPKSVLSWSVRSVEEINEDSLTLFYLLEPKIDILVIGVGDVGNSMDPKMFMYLRSKGISLEVGPTEKVVSVYNFLASEGRSVAGAMIPPRKITQSIL